MTKLKKILKVEEYNKCSKEIKKNYIAIEIYIDYIDSDYNGGEYVSYYQLKGNI